MQDTDRHELIEQLMLETTADGTGSRPTSAQDLSVLVVAALLAASTDDLLAEALRFATTTADRQFVAIAAAYLAGDHDRVDALARDHLLDHPSRPVLAWIVAHSRQPPRTHANPPGAQPMNTIEDTQHAIRRHLRRTDPSSAPATSAGSPPSPWPPARSPP